MRLGTRAEASRYLKHRPSGFRRRCETLTGVSIEPRLALPHQMRQIWRIPPAGFSSAIASTPTPMPIIPIGFCLALTVFEIVCLWKVYQKAGQPGWASIIPIYNAYILLKIAGRPGWWLLLYFVPL